LIAQKLIYDLKTELNPKLKINPSSNLFFHELLRYETPNMNSPHQMKQFDTKTSHFGGIN
jgi:hypothetical protein